MVTVDIYEGKGSARAKSIENQVLFTYNMQ
jgi:hypothetical protein